MRKSRGEFDIRVYKKRLRERYKAIRESMEPEERLSLDSDIAYSILTSRHYKGCSTILCYVSTKQEIDTHRLIERALSDGKRVAAPYCVEGTRRMDFYIIGSLSELERRTFGVLEPVPGKAKRLRDYSGSICIVPGLCFDRDGYRLGYGGGYYDRFLSKPYKGKGATIGVCYDRCMRGELIRGRLDVACDYIITENGVISPEKPKDGM